MTKEEILESALRENNSAFDIELLKSNHYRTYRAILLAMGKYAHEQCQYLEDIIRSIDLELDFADFDEKQKVKNINNIIRKHYNQPV